MSSLRHRNASQLALTLQEPSYHHHQNNNNKQHKRGAGGEKGRQLPTIELSPAFCGSVRSDGVMGRDAKGMWCTAEVIVVVGQELTFLLGSA